MCPRKPDREEISLVQELQRLQARESIPDIEPPALIDQAVRNMARRELKHQSAPVAGKLRWIAGLSTASIALIALGLSMVQTPSGSGPMPESFDSRKLEIRSRGEPSEIAPPAALELSPYQQAPAADAAAVPVESPRQSADRAEDSATLRLKKESVANQSSLSQESALADKSDNSKPAQEAAESVGIDALQSRDESARAWLDRIEQLYEQGSLTETVEQLRAWQHQYPELPLPDWAKGLLPPPSPD